MKRILTIVLSSALLLAVPAAAPAATVAVTQTATSYLTVFNTQVGGLYNQTIYTPDAASKGDIAIGRHPENSLVARFLFQFDVSAFEGKNVTSARVDVTQRWSSSYCGDSHPRSTDLYAVGRYDRTTSWSNQPPWMGLLTSSNAKKFFNSASCPAGTVSFSVTNHIKSMVASGEGTVYMGLKAADETDMSSWKRYDMTTLRLIVEFDA